MTRPSLHLVSGRMCSGSILIKSRPKPSNEVSYTSGSPNNVDGGTRDRGPLIFLPCRDPSRQGALCWLDRRGAEVKPLARLALEGICFKQKN